MSLFPLILYRKCIRRIFTYADFRFRLKYSELRRRIRLQKYSNFSEDLAVSIFILHGVTAHK